jgi:hypothetical protein
MNSRWGSQVEVVTLAAAGGHPGGICLELLHAFGIGAYGLSVNSSDTFNLAVLVLVASSVVIVVCRCGFQTFNLVSHQK